MLCLHACLRECLIVWNRSYRHLWACNRHLWSNCSGILTWVLWKNINDQLTRQLSSPLYYFHYIYLCIVCGHMCSLVCLWKYRTSSGSRLCLSSIWTSGTELRSPVLAAAAFTCCTSPQRAVKDVPKLSVWATCWIGLTFTETEGSTGEEHRTCVGYFRQAVWLYSGETGCTLDL